MNAYSFLRAQVKGLLCFLIVMTLLGMVWVQTKETSVVSVKSAEGAVTSVASPAADKGPEKPTDSSDVGAAGSAGPSTPANETSSDPPSKDEEHRARMVGCWFHIESGEHWLENFPDGTSRLLLKLDFVSSLIYGKQIEMDLTWEVKDGVLTHTIIKGNPQASVDSLVNDFGKARSSNILEVTSDRILLGTLGKKPKQDVWTRSALPKEWTEAKTR